MKICFLIPPPLDKNPPAERIFGCNYGIYNQPNIFMVYVATHLKDHGHDVFIKDCVIERKSVQAFEEFIARDDSEIYVFSSVFLSKNTDLKARDRIRQVRENVRFIYYSTEPSANPQDFVAADSLVIRGEPEATFLDAVTAMDQREPFDGIPGIVFMRDNALIDTGYRPPVENLDQLPYPDRELLPKLNYNNPKLSQYPFTTVLTSRGCPYRCYYCVPNSMSFCREVDLKRETGEPSKKPKYRSRSVGNVVGEIESLARQGYRSFSILDDIFAVDEKWTIEFCQRIAPLGMEWSCLSRADHMTNYEVVEAMGKAGCKFVALGIESFDPKILDYVRKDLDLKTVPVAVENMKRAGVEVEVNVLLGSCELETEETIRQTFEAVKKIDPDYVLISACTPFPYTEFSHIAREKGWAVNPEYIPVDPIKKSSVTYEHLPKEKIEKLLRKFYFQFYYRPGYIWKKIRKIKSPTDFYNKARAALTLFR